MTIILKEDAVDLQLVCFGAPMEASGGIVPLTLPVIHSVPSPDAPRAAKPAPPPMPALPPPVPPPAPPPVVELSPELAQRFYEDSVLRGMDVGHAQAMAELPAFQERYLAALLQLDAVSRQLIDRNRFQVIRLACRVAEKVIRRHLTMEPEWLIEMVNQAFSQLEAPDEIIVHCSPADHQFMVGRVPDLAAGFGESFKLTIRADDTLEQCDFRVDTATAHFDGRVESQVAVIEDALLSDEPLPGGYDA